MTRRQILRWISAAAGILATVTLAAHAQQLRPPAVPLVAHDPYFSIWSPADRLTDAATVHWTGRAHPLASLIRIDGDAARLMGAAPSNIAALPQTSVSVRPTHTIYTFANAHVRVTLTFMTPSLPSDLDVLSRPVTYISWEVVSADAKTHQVQIYFDVGADIAVNTTDQPVQLDYPTADGLLVARVGTPEQPVLARRGDDVRIDWGYGYLAAPSGAGAVVTGGNGGRLRGGFTSAGTVAAPAGPIAAAPVAMGRHTMAVAWDLGAVGPRAATRYAMLAFDDIKSIRYFSNDLVAYWRRNGATMEATLATAARDSRRTRRQSKGVRLRVGARPRDGRRSQVRRHRDARVPADARRHQARRRHQRRSITLSEREL